MAKKIIRAITLLLLAGIFNSSHAQIDTEFWFAAPFVSSHNNSFHLPVYLRFSSYGSPATVTISQPANPSFTPITINLPGSTTQTVDLSPFIAQIHNTPADQVLDRGLLITSTADISVYYEVASTYCNCNPELYALKGRNALGTDFLLSYQNIYQNQQAYVPSPSSTFEIVASEDNTVVTITPTVALVGHASGTPYSVSLNRGQTYSGRALGFNAGSQPLGTSVTSNKPIAATLSDDLVRPTFGSCADLMGDQTIPVNIVGREYIVVKGGLGNPEPVVITATAPNTEVFINGAALPVATLNRGQSYLHYLSAASMYIRASEPIYVLHVSGFGCELGEALLPPIECTGSNRINVYRTTASQFTLDILAPVALQNNFTLNGSTALIPGSAFTVVPGTNGQWISAQITFTVGQIPVGSVVSVANTLGRFHMGVLNGSAGGGCSYGYFSNFGEPVLLADDTARFCFNDTLDLITTSDWDSIWWVELSTLDTLGTDTLLQVGADNRILLITELASCRYYDTITVRENDSIYFWVNVQPSICNASNGSISITSVTGNYGSYDFLLNNQPLVPPFTNLAAGPYTISLVDSFSCEATIDTVVLTTGGNVSIHIDSAGQLPCSFSDSSGFLAYTITGGIAPYSVYLNGSLMGTNIQDAWDSLPRGTYSLMVTDFNGCIATWDTVFNVPPAPLFSLVPDSASMCFGEVEIINITPYPWDYIYWMDRATHDTLGTQTSYTANSTVNVIVEAGFSTCQYLDTIAVTMRPEITINAAITPVECIGDSNGAINITSTNGVTGVPGYTLNGNTATPPFNNLPAGLYDIVLTDPNTCQGNLSLFVPNPIVWLLPLHKPLLPNAPMAKSTLALLGAFHRIMCCSTTHH